MKKENAGGYEAFKKSLDNAPKAQIENKVQDMLCCSKCGYGSPVQAKFCGYCGTRLGSEPEITKLEPEIVDEEPKSQDEMKGNGHKPPTDIPGTVVAFGGGDRDAMLRDQEETRRRMAESEKEKLIPGNRYIFNREQKHLLETARISEFQLHNFVVARIQNKILQKDWDMLAEPVGLMYVDGMLEGSIAVNGKSRDEFLAMHQFKSQEQAQAQRGGLFDNGPRSVG